MAMIGDSESIRGDCIQKIRNAARSLYSSAISIKAQIADIKYSETQITNVFSDDKAQFITDKDAILELCEYIVRNVPRPIGD